MKKIYSFGLVIMMVLVLCGVAATPVEAAKRPTIDSIANTYVTERVTEGRAYESVYELLENNGYKATKQNVSDMKKALAKYEKFNKVAVQYYKDKKAGWRYVSVNELLADNNIKETKTNVKIMKAYIKINK